MIELKNINRAFDGRVILKDVNLTIKTGESLVIIGRSGCGKSVLLKHIIGLLRPDSGNVIIDGLDIAACDYAQLNEVRKKFGMLFQNAALFDSMTVFENVGFQLIEYTNQSFEKIGERVAECLKMVGLEGVEKMKPNELSGGMRKRVGLARALCMAPKIMLYDEPTAGIDPIMGDVITNLIRHTHDSLKLTSVTVTHDMRSAKKIADRICMFYDRKLVEVGTPEDAERSDNEVVRQFISGDSKGPLADEE
ncbi:MAG TPA: ABC transporter ATP-binding protein [Candidatus Omnitrophota bacterium]|nr:ABC transporter ATP-binding protein [Candidatus Omnitrophota bacterium]HPS20421.1 ABC transporter ATP-binding protein [Candidatus Omnitrophota bacterium]